MTDTFINRLADVQTLQERVKRAKELLDNATADLDKTTTKLEEIQQLLLDMLPGMWHTFVIPDHQVKLHEFEQAKQDFLFYSELKDKHLNSCNYISNQYDEFKVKLHKAKQLLGTK